MLRSRSALPVVDSFGFKIWAGPVKRQQASHMHTDVEVNFVFNGEVEYFMAGRLQTLPARRFGLLWAGVPHQLTRTAPKTRMAWITLPIGWVMKWDLGDALVPRLLRGELVAERNSRSADARGELDERLIEQWLADESVRDPTLRRATLAEIQGRVQRLAAAAAGSPHPPKQPIGADAVQRISAYLAAHYADDISLADIAEQVDLHPNYVMNVFKEACGIGVWEYVLRLRIGHAQRLLLTTDAKITQIAYDCGFNSAGRFYTAFGRVCGQTPKEYRRTHAGEMAGV